ncbi:MAG TPA: hypothetical protein VMX13_07480 [Sedimentisphaerales bacterium]|nr:hypothetical protein [Sedimentisphaerales bacterium]
MEKSEIFLREVHSALIIRRILDQPGAGHKAMWHALIDMDDAQYASERIPEDMTAHKAACEFIEFVFKDNKDPDYNPPSWFIRP